MEGRPLQRNRIDRMGVVAPATIQRLLVVLHTGQCNVSNININNSSRTIAITTTTTTTTIVIRTLKHDMREQQQQQQQRLLFLRVVAVVVGRHNNKTMMEFRVEFSVPDGEKQEKSLFSGQGEGGTKKTTQKKNKKRTKDINLFIIYDYYFNLCQKNVSDFFFLFFTQKKWTFYSEACKKITH
eukprot:PhM_4_TR13929/c1_g1_i4/m.100546